MDNSTAPAENKGHGVVTRARSCQTFVIKILPRHSVYVAFCGSDEFDGVVLAALRDTESALSTYSRDLQREEELTTARAREFEAQEQAQQLYVGGKTGFLTLLEAERDLASADDALASLHAQLATDQVALFFALGGGWDS